MIKAYRERWELSRGESALDFSCSAARAQPWGQVLYTRNTAIGPRTHVRTPRYIAGMMAALLRHGEAYT